MPHRPCRIGPGGSGGLGGPGGHRHAAGFTLIEILVVLMLVGITLTVVPPLFTGGFGNAKLRNDARGLASSMRHLRAQAIASQTPQALTLDVETRAYRMDGREKVIDMDPDTHVELITTQSEMLDDGVGRIRFFADGGATGGQVILTRNTRRLVLDVDWVTGRVKTYEETVD